MSIETTTISLNKALKSDLNTLKIAIESIKQIRFKSNNEFLKYIVKFMKRQIQINSEVIKNVQL